jgi:hypothetical protein
MKKGLRYLWLSSSDLPHGTGSGSPLHFKFRLADLPRDARIVIVEGVLKADVLPGTSGLLRGGDCEPVLQCGCGAPRGRC